MRAWWYSPMPIEVVKNMLAVNAWQLFWVYFVLDWPRCDSINRQWRVYFCSIFYMSLSSNWIDNNCTYLARLIHLVVGLARCYQVLSWAKFIICLYMLILSKRIHSTLQWTNHQRNILVTIGKHAHNCCSDVRVAEHTIAIVRPGKLRNYLMAYWQ